MERKQHTHTHWHTLLQAYSCKTNTKTPITYSTCNTKRQADRDVTLKGNHGQKDKNNRWARLG